MKKFLTLALIILLSATAACARDNVTRDVNVLPAQARKTLATHFKKTPVSHIKVDKELFGTDYDVILNNGTEIEFDKEGYWKDIDCGSYAVPSALIPAAVLSYVKKNFGGQKIVEISKSDRKYEVTLSSGTELEFDRAGNFKKIDN